MRNAVLLVVLCLVQATYANLNIRDLLKLREVRRQLHKREACGGGQIACSSGSGCVDREMMCNGVSECSDGSDELIAKCSEEGICVMTCPAKRGSREVCVKDIMLCDGRADCRVNNQMTDISIDEQVETCQSHGRCLLRCNAYQSMRSSWVDSCIPEKSICNMQVDCQNKEDELEAACTSVGRDECPLLCSGANERLCVPAHRICDGINDCADTADDENPSNCRKRVARNYISAQDLF